MAAQEEEDPAQSGDPGQMDANPTSATRRLHEKQEARDDGAFTVFVLCGTSAPFNSGFLVVWGGASVYIRSRASLGELVEVWAAPRAAARDREANNSQS